MTTTASLPVVTATAERLRYGGLVVVMLMSFLLVTAEFLPNGVLTEMAASLGVTPGQAGQTVTVTAFVGLLVAVPLAAAVGVLCRFALERYLQSPFYTGEGPYADALPGGMRRTASIEKPAEAAPLAGPKAGV